MHANDISSHIFNWEVLRHPASTEHNTLHTLFVIQDYMYTVKTGWNPYIKINQLYSKPEHKHLGFSLDWIQLSSPISILHQNWWIRSMSI